jgi:hypothetical protein
MATRSSIRSRIRSSSSRLAACCSGRQQCRVWPLACGPLCSSSSHQCPQQAAACGYHREQQAACRGQACQLAAWHLAPPWVACLGQAWCLVAAWLHGPHRWGSAACSSSSSRGQAAGDTAPPPRRRAPCSSSSRTAPLLPSLYRCPHRAPPSFGAACLGSPWCKTRISSSNRVSRRMLLQIVRCSTARPRFMASMTRRGSLCPALLCSSHQPSVCHIMVYPLTLQACAPRCHQ